ncbi:type III-A CRISPR-associated RAMP protein Csm4 [Saccharolobus islandicus]|uniref:type III-A CRISPR-associated RAMP protein Csm4 n=1 Tax=Saccharolobus islandicus TaxID=43080 RepID=UPI00037DDE5E|nr:hypothetical protein [Sulfolobus islandicus]
MKLIIVKFTSPFKIAERENYIDAITLYRAFIKALSLLGETFDEIKNGEVKFSSMFPIVDNKLYLKMPFKTIQCDNRDMEKELKKIEYIDVNILKEVEPPYRLECRGTEKYVKGINGKEIKLESNYLSSYGETIVEYKNRMDRLVNSADIYASPSFMPKHEMGFLSTNWNDKLDKTLRLLEKLGIGKDKNLGYGRFTVKEIKDYNLSFPEKRQYKYVTGRAYTEHEFLAERLDKVQILGGDISPVLFNTLILLPIGSLVKNIKRILLEKENNIVIIDPILL